MAKSEDVSNSMEGDIVADDAERDCNIDVLDHAGGLEMLLPYCVRLFTISINAGRDVNVFRTSICSDGPRSDEVISPAWHAFQSMEARACCRRPCTITSLSTDRGYW